MQRCRSEESQPLWPHRGYFHAFTLNEMWEADSLNCTVAPWNQPCESCQINALHRSSVHVALKACSPTQITALLNYNSGGPGGTVPGALWNITDRLSRQRWYICHLESCLKQTANIQGSLTAAFVKVCNRTRQSPQTFQSLLASYLMLKKTTLGTVCRSSYSFWCLLPSNDTNTIRQVWCLLCGCHGKH